MTTFIMIELNYAIISESTRIKSEIGANDNLAFILFPLYFRFSVTESVRVESGTSSIWGSSVHGALVRLQK